MMTNVKQKCFLTGIGENPNGTNYCCVGRRKDFPSAAGVM